MNVNSENYVDLALRTEANPQRRLSITSLRTRLLHASMGLCTEAGEFQSILKRSTFYYADLNKTELLEELGDILWYVALACDVMDVSLDEVMSKNIRKLRFRYPEVFSSLRAIKRNVEKERELMEK